MTEPVKRSGNQSTKKSGSRRKPWYKRIRIRLGMIKDPYNKSMVGFKVRWL